MNAVRRAAWLNGLCIVPDLPAGNGGSRRFLSRSRTKVEAFWKKHGIPDGHIVMRVTGCPNGCGRAMLASN